MLEIGIQTWNAVDDANPREGFEMLKRARFSCCDFSLNSYLKNTDIYEAKINHFFDASIEALKEYFQPHKEAAKETGIRIHQIHMPYPLYVPTAEKCVNRYLWNEVASKSMELCHFFDCKYIVIHGFKLSHFLGSEELEWQETEKFIHAIAPLAVKYGITICIENLYNSVGGHLVEGPCCDARKTVERIDWINTQYGQDVLGFCFDVGHANLLGLDFEKFLTTLESRLKILHIHDNDGISDLHQIPFTFAKTRENTSSTDWEGFLRGLKNIGFDGVLSFETGPALKSFPNELKVETFCFISHIGRYFQTRLSDEIAVH